VEVQHGEQDDLTRILHEVDPVWETAKEGTMDTLPDLRKLERHLEDARQYKI
jgi:hypothetical protein